MVNIRTAAAGRRQYGMGSYAPTRGKVNPAGYVKRELKGRLGQPVQGRDNFGRPSESRSGLAAAALNKRFKGASPPRMLPKKQGVSNGPKFNKKPNAIKGMIPKKAAPKGGGASSGPLPPSITPAQIRATMPTVKINANGRLDLPFDAAYGLGLVEQQQAADAELMQLQQDEQQWGLDLQNARRDLDTQFTDIKRDTLNEHAGRGLAFSSGYGDSVLQNQNQYNTFQNDLASQDALARSGFSNARTGIENAMNDFIRMATQRRVEELSAEAGKLGFGVSGDGNWIPPTPTPKPPAKPKSKPKNNNKPKEKPKNSPKPPAKPKKKGK